jgi:hypothetical protein
LFGLSFQSLDCYFTGVVKKGVRYFASSVIDLLWERGFNTVGFLTSKSIAYVAGYSAKKFYGDRASAMYGDALPPFVLMSKGIGKAWCESHQDQILSRPFIQMDKFRIGIPRYFRNLLSMDAEFYRDRIYEQDTIEVDDYISQMSKDVSPAVFEKYGLAPFVSGSHYGCHTGYPTPQFLASCNRVVWSSSLRMFYSPAFLKTRDALASARAGQVLRKFRRARLEQDVL